MLLGLAEVDFGKGLGARGYVWYVVDCFGRRRARYFVLDCGDGRGDFGGERRVANDEAGFGLTGSVVVGGGHGTGEAGQERKGGDGVGIHLFPFFNPSIKQIWVFEILKNGYEIE